MPELNEVLEQSVDDKDKLAVEGIVDVTTIDREVTTKPATTSKKKTPVKFKEDEKKPEAVTETVEPVIEKTVETTETVEVVEPEPVTETKKPAAKAKAKKEVKDGEEEKDALRRPPMEQLTKDFERHIATLSVAGHQLKKLEYKCGKVIYGLHNEEGKDFRVIAFKARKKSKTVAGKSRCIFYFGVSKELQTLTKKFPGTTTTEFGKCSVQVKKPIQLILDKTTFAEQFDQDIEKVMTILKGLADVTIEQKTEQWLAFQEKLEAKKLAASTEEKKEKASKKFAAGDE